MAQNVKDMAARMSDNRSFNFSDFIARIKRDEDGYTKWDLVKGTFWYAWYKFSDWMVEVFFPIAGTIIKGFVIAVAFVLLEVVLFVAFIIVGIPFGLIAFATMPIWFWLTYAFSPAKAADFLFGWGDVTDDQKVLIGYVAWVAWYNLLFRVVGKFFFLPLAEAGFMPMSHRKHFMARERSLKSYDAGTQIAYVMAFETENERKNAIGNMSYQSVEKFWADYPKMHSLILAGWMLCEKWANQLLLSNEEGDWNLIVSYVYNPSKRLGEDVLNYFIDKMKDPEIGTKARKVFSVYGQRHTLSVAVLEELITVAGKGNENAQKALSLYAKREALSPDLLDEVYSTENKELIAEMQSIAKMHADISMVQDSERDQWVRFCQLEANIDSEAQKRMGHGQYLVYKQTGHQLEREALKSLLLSRSYADGYGDSFHYFRELVEGEFEQIDEQLKAQICTENWRQKVYYQVASARAEKTKTEAEA